MEKEEEEEENVGKVKDFFGNVDLKGNCFCTADCGTRLKHYVHNEESTLEDARAKMKHLHEINLLFVQNMLILKYTFTHTGSKGDPIVHVFNACGNQRTCRRTKKPPSDLDRTQDVVIVSQKC